MLESLERFLGCKLERISGEVLPPVKVCKNSPNLCDVDIQWIALGVSTPELVTTQPKGVLGTY